MTDPAPILLDADPLYIGYDWEIPVALTDDATGAPIDISTWTIGGDFWTPYQAASNPMELVVTNLDVPGATWSYEVPSALTSGIKIDVMAAGSYPCRIMAWYLDATGKRRALRPIFIQPRDPRTSTL